MPSTPARSKGGDTRGMQSAGLLVVRPIPPGSDSTVERIVDVRVDDHESPFVELRRLMRMTLGEPNTLTERAAILSRSGQHAEAIRLQREALAINPRSEALMYALAQRYAQAGDTRQGARTARPGHCAAARAVEGAGGRRSDLRAAEGRSGVPRAGRPLASGQARRRRRRG